MHYKGFLAALHLAAAPCAQVTGSEVILMTCAVCARAWKQRYFGMRLRIKINSMTFSLVSLGFFLGFLAHILFGMHK